MDKFRTWESEEDMGIRRETVMARTVQIFFTQLTSFTRHIQSQHRQKEKSKYKIFQNSKNEILKNYNHTRAGSKTIL